MSDYRLEVFRVVAETKAISAAARKLNISQPAVTRHIKHLEEDFQTPLLVRSASGIALTNAGYVLLDHALRVADLDLDVARRIGQSSGKLTGLLRVGASRTITQHYLPPRLASFLKQHPEVRLSFLDGNTEEMIGALLAHRIDVAFVEGICHRGDLKIQRFYEDEIICVAARHHALAKARVVPIERLASEPVILREVGSGTREYAELALKRLGLKPERLQVLAEVPNSSAIKQLVQAGLGVSFLSRLIVEDELRRGTLAEIRVRGLSIRRPFLALHPAGPAPAGVAGAFLAEVVGA